MSTDPPIIPLEDRVVLRRLEAQYEGVIHIPDTAKEQSMECEVVAVGPGRTLDTGLLLPMPVQKGDRVLAGVYAGVEFERPKGSKWVVIRADEILGVVPAEQTQTADADSAIKFLSDPQTSLNYPLSGGGITK